MSLSSEAKGALIQMLERSFTWSIDYTLANDGEKPFLAECRVLDEIAEFCEVTDDFDMSYVDAGHDVIQSNKEDPETCTGKKVDE